MLNWSLSEKLTNIRPLPHRLAVFSHVGRGVERWARREGCSVVPAWPVSGGPQSLHCLPQWTIFILHSHHLQDTCALQQICLPSQTGNFFTYTNRNVLLLGEECFSVHFIGEWKTMNAASVLFLKCHCLKQVEICVKQRLNIYVCDVDPLFDWIS